MDDKIFESIIEITKKQDSDEFGISIVATIAELVPNSTVTLLKCFDYPVVHYGVVTTLSAQQDQDGIKQYIWDADLPDVIQQYINDNFIQLIQLTVFQTKDGLYNTFIPIHIDRKIAYAINICSKSRFSAQLSSLLAITKVCQNFYAILSCSEKDSLTGLFNRRTYDQKLNALLRKQYTHQLNNINLANRTEMRTYQHQSFTWLAILDIDFFKKVNDKYGHIYGDEVLLVLSQLMQRAFRNNDLLFRFGGEEFIVIFEPIQKEQAHSVLDKFRQMVEKYSFPMVGNITVSCGYAKISEKDHPKTVFDNADKALYYAKENGRNCIHNFEALVKEQHIKTVVEEGDIELF